MQNDITIEQRKELLAQQVHDDMIKIAVFFFTTHGMPFEIFKDMTERDNPTIAEQIKFIISFDKKHPNIVSGVIN